MKQDEYLTVYNGPETYKEIAEELRIADSVIFAWTDEQGTQFDILMSVKPIFLGGLLQGGISPERDLFVSIMRIGAFGFEINEIEKYPSYVDEKFMGRTGASSTKLAELINGVIKELYV